VVKGAKSEAKTREKSVLPFIDFVFLTPGCFREKQRNNPGCPNHYCASTLSGSISFCTCLQVAGLKAYVTQYHQLKDRPHEHPLILCLGFRVLAWSCFFCFFVFSFLSLKVSSTFQRRAHLCPGHMEIKCPTMSMVTSNSATYWVKCTNSRA